MNALLDRTHAVDVVRVRGNQSSDVRAVIEAGHWRDEGNPAGCSHRGERVPREAAIHGNATDSAHDDDRIVEFPWNNDRLGRAQTWVEDSISSGG